MDGILGMREYRNPGVRVHQGSVGSVGKVGMVYAGLPLMTFITSLAKIMFISLRGVAKYVVLPTYINILYNILWTSAVSSTNLRSILSLQAALLVLVIYL